jgi:hypothetical protein
MTTQGMPSMDPRPTGLTIGTYDTYREAQRAVDYLSDQKFPVEHTTIVGNNLRQVEKITGRLTWGSRVWPAGPGSVCSSACCSASSPTATGSRPC